MALAPFVIFFISGAAGLLFETLWFRVTGLTLGNSFLASNIVLASFMAGLAGGNAIAARYGHRLRNPLQLYAWIEGIVGLTGFAIVQLLPLLNPSLGRLFTQVLAYDWLVNFVRFAFAFSVMLVPATAMGLTLPLLAKAIERRDPNFGRVLGRLYGWNTLGGMCGALGGELWLIGWLGQRGTALVACALSLGAGIAAFFLSRRAAESTTHLFSEEPRAARAATTSWALPTAAFLTGATLLALELVWFRFLQLFVFGTSFIFAAMLAVILLGIGAGAVIAAGWVGRDPYAPRFAPFVALAAGVAVELSYALFEPRVGSTVYITGDSRSAFALFLRLMLPTSILSGVLFTLLGSAYRRVTGEAAASAGKLTLANTLGAMVGSLLTGFVLLPHLGVENTLFLEVVSYGLVAGIISLVPGLVPRGQHRRKLLVPAFAAFAVCTALYPFRLMTRHFVPLVIERYQSSDPEIIAIREGLTDMVMYLRSSFRGQPTSYRLMTNGHSMSATTYRGRRYMKMYVYWSLAVNPNARKALLISYGVGSTAKALTDTRQLDSIDVVDISRDILELGSLAFPTTEPPLRDPRIRVHVEDGRFFLQTTGERFDLITAEPPPVRGAGITNLYSREYFQLIHDRLRDGGVATYWLPVNQLWPSETKAIMKGFCDAFPDCSLWSGAGLQWMLAGTRGARGPVPIEQFSAQWGDRTVGPELVELGFEKPETLAATFLADAVTIDEWTRGSPPLDDDHPGLILPRYPPDEYGDPVYREWMEPRAVRARFESSSFLRNLWPEALRRTSVDYLAPRALFDDLCVWGSFNPVVAIHGLLTHSSLRTLPLLFMGTEPAFQRIAVALYESGVLDSGIEFEMGARALSERDYERAAQHLALVTEGPRMVQAQLLRTLALALQGRISVARHCLESIGPDRLSPVDAYAARWLDRYLQAADARSHDSAP